MHFCIDIGFFSCILHSANCIHVLYTCPVIYYYNHFITDHIIILQQSQVAFISKENVMFKPNWDLHYCPSSCYNLILLRVCPSMVVDGNAPDLW